MPSNMDKFAIIVSEICTKQNGITLNAGDDRVLKDLFLKVGGDIEDLEQGVLDQFDTLKAVIIAAYEGQLIASDPFGSRISTIRPVRGTQGSAADHLQGGHLASHAQRAVSDRGRWRKILRQ